MIRQYRKSKLYHRNKKLTKKPARNCLKFEQNK